MKKAINFILIVLSIISVLTALKLSSLPVAPFLPETFKDFFVTTEYFREKYSLIYDFSVGFLLSAMFYFIVSEIPDKMKLYRARKLVGYNTNLLLENLERSINLVISKYSICDNLKLVSQKDFWVFDGDINATMEEVSYSTITYSTKGKRITAIHSFGTINNIVKDEIKSMLENIECIKNYEYLYAAQLDFVECIRRIEGSQWIRLYRNDKPSPNKCFLFANSSVAFDELLSLYRKLIKLKYHTKYTITTIDELEKNLNYKEERNSGKLIADVVQINIDRKRKAGENLSAVVFGSEYYSQIIVKQLKKRVNAIFMHISEVDLCTIEKCKYLFCVVDEKSIKEFICLNQKIFHNIEQVVISDKRMKNKTKALLKDTEHIKQMKALTFKKFYQVAMLPIYINAKEPNESSIAKIVKDVDDIVQQA